MAESPEEFRSAVTEAIRFWLVAFQGEAETDPALHCLYRELRAAALEPDDDESAGPALRDKLEWRLTVDPGVKGPFGSLSATLISLLLDLADWTALAHWIRCGDDDVPGDGPEDDGP
jgi:hypothetical protein